MKIEIFGLNIKSIYFAYMKKPDEKKLIELPSAVVKALKVLAEKERSSTKGYMEKVLIDHVKPEVKKD